MSKKIISLFLSVLMLFGCAGFSACAEESVGVPLSAGREALQARFEKGIGPETNGYSIDYRYFSPVSDSDTVTAKKYPLVVWLHGMGEGSHEGEQIIGNDIAFWSSSDYQSRFKGSGGAFLFVPRSIEEKMIYWDDSMIEPLRAALDDFIAKNIENIDLSRIYIGGFSMGGKMTLKMAVAYPETFAAAFPICPAWDLPDEYASYLADMPVWLTSGKQDPLVNYASSVAPTWEKIIKASNDPDNCRFSTLSKTLRPDGSNAPSGHHAWIAVTNDMFSSDNENYPSMSTVDGNGKDVTLTYPDGMISWLSSFTSDYDGTPGNGSGNIKVEEKNANLFSLETVEKIIITIIELVQKIIEIFVFRVR